MTSCRKCLGSATAPAAHDYTGGLFDERAGRGELEAGNRCRPDDLDLPRFLHLREPRVGQAIDLPRLRAGIDDPVLGHAEPRGSRRATPSPTGPAARRAPISAWPQVTVMSGMTEAPDETAQGEWLSLVTKAGFSFLMAHVK